MPASIPAEIDPAQEAGDPALLRALATPAMYPGHPSVAVHETHASWVFVVGERAYKVKKPVALGFLDYSTLALRHRACREEVRVNQALAPGLYLGVRAIVKSSSGFRIASEDEAGAVEYLVEMRSFDERRHAGWTDRSGLADDDAHRCQRPHACELSPHGSAGHRLG